MLLSLFLNSLDKGLYEMTTNDILYPLHYVESRKSMVLLVNVHGSVSMYDVSMNLLLSTIVITGLNSSGKKTLVFHLT